MSLFNSTAAAIQGLLYSAKIESSQLVAEPTFVVGHWRSGTTLLHELLVLDKQFTFPTTFTCFCPNHCLVSEWWLKRMVGIFLPRKRPMDNMAIGWDLPQEDEWALCNMGLSSPYFKIMFPNIPVKDKGFYTLEDVPLPAREEWKSKFLWFLKCLTLREPKPIILKTPVHTFRMQILSELFPNARFIHIVRNPFVVIPSTIHTWKRMYRYHGLQVPKFEELESEVLSTFAEMYSNFWSQKALLSPDNFYELRYEELSENPISEIQAIYSHFGWSESEETLSARLRYTDGFSEYETNRYQLTNSLRDKIRNTCASYFQQYAYDPESAS